MAPALVGDDFMARWNGLTVGDLFEIVQTTMPADSSGRLRRSQYSDLVAYLLSANQFPAGQTELGQDVAALKQIKWESAPPSASPR